MVCKKERAKGYLLLGLMSLFLISCSGITPNSPQEAWRGKQKALAEAEEEGLKTGLQMTAEGYERLGDAYLKQGHQEMALLQYDKALRSDPNRVTIR